MCSCACTVCALWVGFVGLASVRPTPETLELLLPSCIQTLRSNPYALGPHDLRVRGLANISKCTSVAVRSAKLLPALSSHRAASIILGVQVARDYAAYIAGELSSSAVASDTLRPLLAAAPAAEGLVMEVAAALVGRGTCAPPVVKSPRRNLPRPLSCRAMAERTT